MDNEERRWRELEQRVARMMTAGELAGAADELDRYLASMPEDRRWMGEAHGYRGSVAEEQRDLPSAISHYTRAHALSEASSYSRYTLELSLGAVYEDLGDREAALKWLRTAILTTLSGDGTSAGAALVRLLKIVGEEQLARDDKEIVTRAILKSWKVLRQSGEPDVSHLMATSQQLVELGSRRRQP